jgi:hypothetical protein
MWSGVAIFLVWMKSACESGVGTCCLSVEPDARPFPLSGRLAGVHDHVQLNVLLR